MGRPKKEITEDSDHVYQPDILLNKDWGFKSDPLCVVLLKKEKVRKAGSLNFGQEFWKIIGYYNDFSDCLKAICDKEIQTDNVSFDNMMSTLKGLRKDIERMFKGIKIENIQV